MPHTNGRTTTAHGEYAGRFLAALNDIGVGAAELSLDGKLLAVNQRFGEIIGLAGEELRRTSLVALLQLKTAGLTTGAQTASTTDSPVSKNDGTTAWIRSSLAALRAPAGGSATSLLLIITDVTPLKAAEHRADSTRHTTSARRDVAGRLINAIEAERSRIARELHDDIGQSLAVIVIQMLRAGKPVSDAPGRRHADIAELGKRVQEIASRVGRLSHELHSSRLEYLGLEKSIRGACSDFAKGQPMVVECICEGVPVELDSAIALCLLRVVQEGLHNAGKHSRGSRVRVELKGGVDALAVVIEDDGVGFDVAAATMAEGIGLISMRERAAFVGGTFEVSSTPAQGTRIEVRVPLI